MHTSWKGGGPDMLPVCAAAGSDGEYDDDGFKGELGGENSVFISLVGCRVSEHSELSIKHEETT
jgi:hypothetical protein